MIIFFTQGRFSLDNLKKMKNKCSKTVGAKMKAREAVGTDDTLPEGLDLEALTEDVLKANLLQIWFCVSR